MQSKLIFKSLAEVLPTEKAFITEKLDMTEGSKTHELQNKKKPRRTEQSVAPKIYTGSESQGKVLNFKAVPQQKVFILY